MESEKVEIIDRYTKTSWKRKIGDGPWVNMLMGQDDLPPIVLFRPLFVPEEHSNE